MTNAYYSSPTDVEAGVKVRSLDINTLDQSVDAAFDKLPTETNLKQGKVNYAVDTGTANAYVVSLPHAPASYADGLEVKFKPITTNTGASTINVNSLGVKSIKKYDGTDPVAGDIRVNAPLTLTYNSTTGFFYMPINAGEVGPAGILSGTATGAINELKGADIASASTVNLQTATGNLVHITGTTGISTITLTSGAERDVVFDGALTLTHSANLILPGAANITTAAGDRATFRGDGEGIVRCIHYTKANGQPVVAPSSGVGDHEVVVHTGNGHGSTNTCIRRFTTTQTSVGTAITYADSAANGASFTINESGLYALHYGDFHSATWRHGASVNSAQLTTSVASINVANRLLLTAASASNLVTTTSRIVKLTAGDVVRPHTDGATTGATDAVFFAIRKVGTV